MKNKLILFIGLFLLMACDDDSIKPRNISSLNINGQEITDYEVEPIRILESFGEFQVYVYFVTPNNEEVTFRITQANPLGEHVLDSPFNGFFYEDDQSRSYATLECDASKAGLATVTRFMLPTSSQVGIYSASFSGSACDRNGNEVTISGEVVDYVIE